MSERKKMVTAEEIEEAALELPREELDGLIGRLIARLPGADDDDHSWLAEAMRRSEEIRSGRAETFAWEDVLAEMERDL